MPNSLALNYQSGLMYSTFCKQAYPTATGLAIVLLGPPPTVNSYVEVANVGGYARQPYSQTVAAWSYPYPNSGIVYNNNTITFPVASAYIGWASGIAIADCIGYGGGITGSGSILFDGLISPAFEIVAQSQLIINVSGLSCRMS